MAQSDDDCKAEGARCESTDDLYDEGFAILEFPELAKTAYLKSFSSTDSTVRLQLKKTAFNEQSNLTFDNKFHFTGDPTVSQGTNLFFQLRKNPVENTPEASRDNCSSEVVDGALGVRTDTAVPLEEQTATFLGFSRDKVTYRITRPGGHEPALDASGTSRRLNSAPGQCSQDTLTTAAEPADGSWLW